jgi:hypothetical protein
VQLAVLLLVVGWHWRERRTTHQEASMPSCLLLHQVPLAVQQQLQQVLVLLLLLLPVEAAVQGSSASPLHLV